ncbi:hypothetical protein J6590_030742 [Homalodisca vitripennis]|nr:hypothetical protein J6590_030742 [Homalodisca vitripennis]
MNGGGYGHGRRPEVANHTAASGWGRCLLDHMSPLFSPPCANESRSHQRALSLREPWDPLPVGIWGPLCIWCNWFLEYTNI